MKVRQNMNQIKKIKNTENLLDQVKCIEDTSGFFCIEKEEALIENK